LSYSNANEISATATTSESNKLNELRQKESLWSTNPYAIIYKRHKTVSFDS